MLRATCHTRNDASDRKAAGMTVQNHDYSTAPFGVWDAASTEDSMQNERENAVTRLLRPSIGATSRAQAELLVDEIGIDTINSESDEDLAARVANPEGVVHNPDAAVIAEVLAEVGDDPAKAQVALDAEKAGKARVTLIAALEAKLSTPVAVADGESVPDAGVEAAPVAQPEYVPAEVTPAPGDAGAPDEATREAAGEQPNPA
jgi:hypothetical protein